MAYDFSGMDPEELKELFEAMKNHMGSGGDEQQDKHQLQPIVEAIQMIAEQFDSLKDRLDKLEDHYFNEFIGGLENLFNDNVRHDGVEALRGKYSGDFEPFMDLVKEQVGDSDPFEKIYDHLHDHWDDEEFDPDDFMDAILSELSEKHGRMKKMFAPPEPEEPEGEATEVEVVGRSKKPKEVEEVTDKDLEKIMKHPSVRMMAG